MHKWNLGAFCWAISCLSNGNFCLFSNLEAFWSGQQWPMCYSTRMCGFTGKAKLPTPNLSATERAVAIRVLYRRVSYSSALCSSTAHQRQHGRLPVRFLFPCYLDWAQQRPRQQQPQGAGCVPGLPAPGSSAAGWTCSAPGCRCPVAAAGGCTPRHGRPEPIRIRRWWRVRQGVRGPVMESDGVG